MPFFLEGCVSVCDVNKANDINKYHRRLTISLDGTADIHREKNNINREVRGCCRDR